MTACFEYALLLLLPWLWQDQWISMIKVIKLINKNLRETCRFKGINIAM